MKRDTVNYTLVGAVVLVALALLIAILFVITGKQGTSASYFANYDDVTGLGFGTPVFYQGFRIGQVSGITPVRQNGKTTYRTELTVKRNWPMPEDSVAELTSSGLLADVSAAGVSMQDTVRAFAAAIEQSFDALWIDLAQVQK